MLYHVHDVLRWKGFFQTGRAQLPQDLAGPLWTKKKIPCLIPKKQIQWFLMICVPNKIVRGYSGLYKYYCIHKCNNTPKSSLVGGAIKILKNMSHWEGLYIPYMKWKIPKPCLKPPTRSNQS